MAITRSGRDAPPPPPPPAGGLVSMVSEPPPSHLCRSLPNSSKTPPTAPKLFPINPPPWSSIATPILPTELQEETHFQPWPDLPSDHCNLIFANPNEYFSPNPSHHPPQPQYYQTQQIYSPNIRQPPGAPPPQYHRPSLGLLTSFSDSYSRLPTAPPAYARRNPQEKQGVNLSNFSHISNYPPSVRPDVSLIASSSITHPHRSKEWVDQYLKSLQEKARKQSPPPYYMEYCQEKARRYPTPLQYREYLQEKMEMQSTREVSMSATLPIVDVVEEEENDGELAIENNEEDQESEASKQDAEPSSSQYFNNPEGHFFPKPMPVVEVSLGEMQSTVSAVLEENVEALVEQHRCINIGSLYAQVKELHPWADAKLVKEVIDAKLVGILSERTAEDDKKLLKKKKEIPVKADVEQKNITSPSATLVVGELNPFSMFPSPKENFKAEELRRKANEPYAFKRDKSHTANQLQDIYSQLKNDEEHLEDGVSVAGRIVACRAFGKLVFLTLRDDLGTIQLSCEKEDLVENQFELSKTYVYLGEWQLMYIHSTKAQQISELKSLHCRIDELLPSSEETVLHYDEVEKVDFGTHVDMHTVDCLFTVTFNPMFNPLLEASRVATTLRIKEFGCFSYKMKESYATALSIFNHIKCSEDAVDRTNLKVSLVVCDLGLSIAKRFVFDPGSEVVENEKDKTHPNAGRMCVPAPSVEQFVNVVKATVLADKRWVLPVGKGSMYNCCVPIFAGVRRQLGPETIVSSAVDRSADFSYTSESRFQLYRILEVDYGARHARLQICASFIRIARAADQSLLPHMKGLASVQMLKQSEQGIGMGHATEALHLPGISKRLKFDLVMQSSDLKRAPHCLLTMSNSRNVMQENASTDIPRRNSIQ